MEMLTLREMRPFVRYAQRLNLQKSNAFTNVVSYDCRLFYASGGEGSITVNGTVYRMTKGSLVLFSPGNLYSLASESEGGMTLYGLSFDYTAAHSDKKTPIPPSDAAVFSADDVLSPFTFSDLTLLNAPLYRFDRSDLEPLFSEILSEYKTKLLYYEEKIGGILLSLISEILRSERGNDRNASPFERLFTYVREHYGEALTNADIGAALGYHPNHLNRLAALHTGMSLHRYLQTYRIGKAMELLEASAASIEEIALSVGFSDFAHFSKCFKRHTGYTPSAFRSGQRVKKQ